MKIFYSGTSYDGKHLPEQIIGDHVGLMMTFAEIPINEGYGVRRFLRYYERRKQIDGVANDRGEEAAPRALWQSCVKRFIESRKCLNRVDVPS